MRKVLILITLCMACLAACQPLEESPLAPAAGTADLAPFVSSTASITADYIEGRQGDLWVRVLSPRHASITTTQTIDVTGQAREGAVITVNQQLLLVPPDQFFRTTLTLEPGLNLVEVVASDAENNQVQIILLVTYQP